MPSVTGPSRRAALLSACLAATAPAPSAAVAQADAAKDIEEVIVVGSREPIAPLKLGSAVSVLSRDEIVSRQVSIVSFLLRDLPGLQVSRTGPIGSQTQVRIRGAEGNHTLVLIDGIEATDPVGNFEFDFADLLTTGIERIEVLRGPQSALYGSEAIGGVISIVTREPEKGVEGEALGEGGSFGTVRAGATLSAGLENYGATASVGYYNTDGVSAAPGGPEEDGYENLTVAGKAIATPLDGLELGLVGRYVDAESQFDRQDFATGQVVDADLLRRFEAFYGRAYATLALFDEAWSQSVSAELTDTDSENFADGAPNGFFEGERLKFEYQSTLAIWGTQITGAVEHEELDFASIGPDPSAAQNQRREDDQTSLVGEWRAGFQDKFFLTAGVRHDFNDIFEDATTWRVTGAYLYDSGTRLHGSYGTGITDPTFFDRFGFFPDVFAGNPDLVPEEAEGWDIGLTQSLLDERLIVDATYFRSDLQDEIVPTFDPVTFLSSVENQPGESERQGVEVSATWQPFAGLTLDGAYTYLDAENSEGADEIRRANHIASFTATWRFLNERAELSFDIDYNGEQDDLDFSAFPARRVTLDGFVLGTLAGRFKVLDGVEVFGRVENLFDEDYQNVFGFNTPGIAAYGGIRLVF